MSVRPARSLPPISVNERGAALPMAVLSLTILLSLATALAAVGTSEPTIAVNHERAARARAAAEAGLQVALAALTHPEQAPAGWAPTAGPGPFVTVPGGAGYRIALEVDPAGTAAERANERHVTVTGYAPSDTAPGRAAASFQAIVTRDSIMATFNAPAAIVMPAGGSITAEIDARSSAGAWCQTGQPLAGVVAGATARVSASGSVWGPGDAIPNESGPDVLDGRAAALAGTVATSNLAFTTHELAALRALAAERGTLYSGHPAPARFGGTEASPLPGGLVFVEGNVEIEVDDATWTGWLIAVPQGTSPGSVAFACRAPCAASRRSMILNGLIYAADGVTVETAGDDRGLTVNGAILAMQTGGTPGSLSPRTPADFRVNYDCGAVRGAVTGTATTTGVGLVRHGWYVKNGTYKEVPRQ